MLSLAVGCSISKLFFFPAYREMKANLLYYLYSLLNFNVIFVDVIRHNKCFEKHSCCLKNKTLRNCLLNQLIHNICSYNATRLTTSSTSINLP